MEGLTGEWTNIQTNKQIELQTDGEQIDGRTDEQIEGQTDRWMEGWADRHTKNG